MWDLKYDEPYKKEMCFKCNLDVFPFSKSCCIVAEKNDGDYISPYLAIR